MSTSDDGGRLWRAFLAAAPPAVTTVLIVLATIDRETTRIITGFLQDPIGFIRFQAAGLILDLVTALVTLVVDFILYMLLGGDRQPGLEEPPLGLLDVAVVPLQLLALAVRSIFAEGTAALQQLNQSIAASVEALGLGAFPITAVLVVLEVALALTMAYVVIQGTLTALSFIDVPFVDTGEIIEAVRNTVGAVINAVKGIFGN